jgi:hypothetical protein
MGWLDTSSIDTSKSTSSDMENKLSISRTNAPHSTGRKNVRHALDVAAPEALEATQMCLRLGL